MAYHQSSHPTWVRGLKLCIFCRCYNGRTVAPYVGAWIETMNIRKEFNNYTSHPTWVRGLKLAEIQKEKERKDVAPYVGAWIETI